MLATIKIEDNLIVHGNKMDVDEDQSICNRAHTFLFITKIPNACHELEMTLHTLHLDGPTRSTFCWPNINLYPINEYIPRVS